MSRVLALDPATHCGWAECTADGLGRGTYHGAGVWDLADAGWLRPQRLRALLAERIRQEPRIEALAIEVHMDHGVTVRKPDGSKQRVMAVDAAHLSGALLFAIHEVALGARLPVREVTPTAVKAAAGSGRFNKEQMQAAAQRLLGTSLPHDAADAVFVFCAAYNVLNLTPGARP